MPSSEVLDRLLKGGSTSNLNKACFHMLSNFLKLEFIVCYCKLKAYSNNAI